VAGLPLSAYVHRTILTAPDGTQTEGVNYVATTVWDTGSLQWVKAVQASGGGGGGAVTVADGADVTQGAIADAAVYGDSAGTLSAKLRGLIAIFRQRGTAMAAATASVTGVDSTIVAANASRKMLLIANVGVNTLFIGDGAAAVSNKGICLYPGSTWQMDEYTFTTAAIHAISAAGTTASIQEYQ